MDAFGGTTTLDVREGTNFNNLNISDQDGYNSLRMNHDLGQTQNQSLDFKQEYAYVPGGQAASLEVPGTRTIE